MSKIDDTLRELVARIYNDCMGAYGSSEYPYEGQYEREIQSLSNAIEETTKGDES